MGFRLAGKVALVTGGASGMGAAHVRALAHEGAAVAFGDLNDDAGAQLLDELPGSRNSFYHLDVTDRAGWERTVSEVVEEHGRIDVLVNNAGVQVRSVGIDADEREWELVTSVNQRGVFLGMQAVIPHMVKSGGGSIINVASVAALVGMRGSIPYQGSKAAVLGLTRGAALSYGPQNIRVNAICPGLVITGMTASATEQAVHGLKDLIPLGRDGRPDEIAAAVVFLASEESSYITGVALPIDGGMIIA